MNVFMKSSPYLPMPTNLPPKICKILWPYFLYYLCRDGYYAEGEYRKGQLQNIHQRQENNARPVQDYTTFDRKIADLYHKTDKQKYLLVIPPKFLYPLIHSLLP